ncbi:MAG: hypothetical protein R8P61_06030 [Bacteroidia bacterium]|nr:hypothetical protein [Bacteroidia bacterium]
MQHFEDRLKGGHPNSLGNTLEVVEEVLAEGSRFDELFNCYFSEDEVVRLRVSNAMKRVVKVRKDLLLPYINRFLSEIAEIDQASTQWTLASLFDSLSRDLNDEQYLMAQKIMQKNLAHHQDWIVLNTTMATLAKWAKKDESLRKWMIPHLERLALDERKSVKGRSQKLLKQLV